MRLPCRFLFITKKEGNYSRLIELVRIDVRNCLPRSGFVQLMDFHAFCLIHVFTEPKRETG
ncbi:MAG: hypothetical protein DRH43_09310 [Deltaproteobacteria bacterium]|nr:MAG: hypothetical protein DRH43_09310 [Deltaproteobacteria bacterium]